MTQVGSGWDLRIQNWVKSGWVGPQEKEIEVILVRLVGFIVNDSSKLKPLIYEVSTTTTGSMDSN